MTSRPLILATLLGASLGLPYVVTRTTGEGDEKQSANLAPWSKQPIGRPSAAAADASLGGSDYGTPSRLKGPRFHSLSEVLRMDVNPSWVYSQWDRKTTGLGDPSLFGIRVSLVTGTGPSDFAGSLTYYFNRQDQVQHISLHGRTGDVSQVIRLVTGRFGLRRVPGPIVGEQLYQIAWGGQVKSELKIRPGSVLRTSAPGASYLVNLSLERPGSLRHVARSQPVLRLPAEANTPPAPSTKSPADETAPQDASSAKEEDKIVELSAEDKEKVNRALRSRLRWPN